jgi:hypothetical protein
MDIIPFVITWYGVAGPFCFGIGFSAQNSQVVYILVRVRDTGIPATYAHVKQRPGTYG